MLHNLSNDELNQTWREGWDSAKIFRLNMPKRSWSGLQGQLKRQSAGQSIDFNDHRPYVTGDDIRFVNWQTYARTGQLVLKTFEDEVSPHADILIDGSCSMFLNEDKLKLWLRMVAFLVASCQSMSFNIHLYWASEGKLKKLDDYTADCAPKLFTPQHEIDLNIELMEWHTQSLRILVSDLLFEREPMSVLGGFSKGKGLGYFFCPYDLSESSPPWEDVVEIEEIESGQKQWLHASASFIKKYKEKYKQHFSNWEKNCWSSECFFARFSSRGTWQEALKEAHPSVEVI